MRRFLRNILIFLSVLLPLGSAAAPVSASVLKGPQILALMVKGMGEGKSLAIDQRLELYPVDPDGHTVELTETVRYIFPEKFRSDIDVENFQRIHIVSGDSELTVIDDEISPDADHRFDSYKDLLLYRSRPLLQDRLIRRGMDVGVSSLGRFQGRLAFVIGARYPDVSVTQLWVEKNTFRPMRWLLADNDVKSQGSLLDIRYFDWRPVGKAWYPMRVEFHRDERLVRAIHVDDVQADPVFAKNQFDPAHLRSLYPSASRIEDDRTGKPEMSDVQKVIDDFKKIYE